MVMEADKRVSFEAESVEGDDERTENERSPNVSPQSERKWVSSKERSASGGSSAEQPRRRARSRQNHRRSSSASGSEIGHVRQMALSNVSSSGNVQQESGGSPQQSHDNLKNGDQQPKMEDSLRRKPVEILHLFECLDQIKVVVIISSHVKAACIGLDTPTVY